MSRRQPKVPERLPLRLTAEGPIPASEVCRALNINHKRLRWLVAHDHAWPAVRGRRGQEDKYFLSAVEEGLRVALRDRTF